MVYQGKTYIPIQNFIDLTGISRITIKRYLENGLLKGLVMGRKYWIDEAEFQKYIK